ncbi:exonuclease sbcCD subunit D [Lewinellaceae bacterium SD302]|nr:exonuclease sbcCD subunit D [Lewinellaceae bacterium SD302]
MRLLHTSDWHLGHRLYDREQREEQQLALDWLLKTIEREAIDLLIVAGDIFDTSNPPNYARRQYYDFLGRLRTTGCRHVVIVGGNHDSPSMLNATSEVLRYIDIVVVGAATEEVLDQIIELRNADEQIEAIVAAVPFLRDRDIHYNQAGEDEASRTKRLRQSIREHYQKLGKEVEKYRTRNIPILTTGHLYAHGAEASEKRSKIYIGNRSNIAADDFPAIFDYVALGHIHRAQIVGGNKKVRYSGSLMPLDFSEVADDKIVYILDFNVAKSTADDNDAFSIRSIDVPVFRRLKRIHGSLEEVEESLEKFLAKRELDLVDNTEVLRPWLEIKVESNGPIPLLHDKLKDLIGERPADLLSTQLIRSGANRKSEQRVLPKLDELSVEEVFRRLCLGSEGEEPAGFPELLNSFRELENWRQESEEI